jgi:hypothetical protein
MVFSAITNVIFAYPHPVRRVPLGVRLAQVLNHWSRQYEILDISQPYRPPRPVTGIALLYGDGVCLL